MLSRRLLRVKVIKALYSHLKSGSDSLTVSEKNLIASVDKTYDLYHQLLWIIVEVARYAENRIELGRNKKLPTPEDLDPNTKFIDNLLIRQVEESQALLKFLEKRGLGWVNYPELVKSIYNSLIGSDYYRRYMDSPERSYKQDALFVEDFFIETIEDNEAVEQVVEEQSILWSDDIDFALVMIVKTLSMCRAEQQDIPLLPKYKSDEDEDFLRQLFRSTLTSFDQYTELIDSYTSNWDVERIAFTDNIIMATAISELINFPSIPVKVTLDEYIEISKYYSTPGSGLFINGVLDKAIETLTAEGRIKKIGRGLL